MAVFFARDDRWILLLALPSLPVLALLALTSPGVARTLIGLQQRLEDIPYLLLAAALLAVALRARRSSAGFLAALGGLLAAIAFLDLHLHLAADFHMRWQPAERFGLNGIQQGKLVVVGGFGLVVLGLLGLARTAAASRDDATLWRLIAAYLVILAALVGPLDALGAMFGSASAAGLVLITVEECGEWLVTGAAALALVPRALRLPALRGAAGAGFPA